METSSEKDYFCISHHFRNPKIPFLHYRTSKMLNLCLIILTKSGGSETNGFSERFRRILRWWNLEEWKSGNLKNFKTRVNPIKSKISLKKRDIV